MQMLVVVENGDDRRWCLLLEMDGVGGRLMVVVGLKELMMLGVKYDCGIV